MTDEFEVNGETFRVLLEAVEQQVGSAAAAHVALGADLDRDGWFASWRAAAHGAEGQEIDGCEPDEALGDEAFEDEDPGIEEDELTDEDPPCPGCADEECRDCYPDDREEDMNCDDDTDLDRDDEDETSLSCS